MKVLLYAIITVSLLLSGMVTVLLSQNLDAGAVNTSRSNIKHAAKAHVTGANNPVSQQTVIIKQNTAVVNKCGDGADCSVVATNTNGDITDGGATSDVAITASDGGSACKGHTSCIAIKENGVR